MAGAGYKLFTTGSVLTAAEVNTYLNEQTVMVFNDATARTTALSGVLAEGMVTYLKSTKVVEIYNGTAWASLDDPNAIQNTIVDAKGDLITATASDVPARLAVGANDTLLIADSAQSTGLKWAGGWTTWTPTYANLTIGNGTVIARYQQVGKTVNFEFYFTMGSTSSMGSTPTITMPVTPKYYAKGFDMYIQDFGTALYWGYADTFDGKFYPTVTLTNSTYASIAYLASTTPMTWTTSDNFSIRGTYEAA